MAAILTCEWLSSCSSHSTVNSIKNRLFAAALLLPLLLAFPNRTYATPLTVTVGTFSFDEFIPAADTTPGVDAFNVVNLTDLGLDLDGNGVVAPALSFLNLVATLIDASGSTQTTLGNLAANSVLVDATGASPLLFPDTQLFTSAVLAGTIEGFTAQLADGSVFTAALSPFTVTLLPSNGSSLVAGTDFASITITGDVSSPAPVPEPSTLILFTAGSAAALFRKSRSRRNQPR
jgi:hypothetical protein